MEFKIVYMDLHFPSDSSIHFPLVLGSLTTCAAVDFMTSNTTYMAMKLKPIASMTPTSTALVSVLLMLL